MDPILEIEGLSKHFGSFCAVRELDLQVVPGEILALVGPNGAGKTTTIQMLMGILKASAGRARVRGLDCFVDRAEVKRHVGYVPDEPIFYDYLSGEELLRFVAEMHGFEAEEVETRVGALIEPFELREALSDYAVNYSRGMKKKLAVLAALLHEPALLILDEPTNGLDPIATRTLLELIRGRARAGTAVFYSTHLLDQAERLCDRVGVLHHGRLAAVGTLAELRESLAPGGSLEDVFFEVAGSAPEAGGEDAEGTR